MPIAPVQNPAEAPPNLTEEQIPKPPSIEDDPNVALKTMIESRKSSKTKEKDEKPSTTEEKKDDEQTDDKKDVGGALADALGFRKSKPKEEKKEEKKAEDKPAEPATTEKKADKKEETVVTRKSRKQEVDPVRIASEAAAAAVREAVKTTKPTIQGQEKKESDEFPAEIAHDDDRREYEVAKFLSETNPKYKNAPKTILDNVRKVKSYADRWEAANPGKAFNSTDPEHNEFYAGVQAPWTQSEFIDARVEMGMRKAEERKQKAEEPVLKKQKVEQALEDLKPETDRAVIASAGAIAKAVGEDVFTAISKDGWEKFQESDPIVSGALARTIGVVQPLIETIIQLDEPGARIEFDKKNPLHVSWEKFLLEKEDQLYGTKDKSGKTLVSRSEYINLSEFQKRKHWFLTRDHLLVELAKDAAEIAKSEIESEKDLLQKSIERMGYVKAETKQQSTDESGSTKEKKAAAEKKADVSVKPESPTVGSGAKIDNKGDSKPTGFDGALEKAVGILFRR